MSQLPALPTVLIFRKELLPYSETFIAAQAKALSRYHPLLAGYKAEPAGDAYLQGLDRVLLADYTRMLEWRKLLFKLTGNLPRRFQQTIRDAAPTLLHCHFGTNARAAIPLAHRLRLPLVLTYHGADISKTPRTRSERRRRANAFRAAARIIAVSDFIKQQLLDNGCPPGKITRHYIGVDTELFRPAETPAPHGSTILFVGRLVTKKGLIHLIRAMPLVQARVPAANVLVVGDGELRGPLEREAAALRSNVKFVGKQSPEQVRNYMRNAAVVCIPSIRAPNGDAEGLPMTVIEAQASGAPVVVSPSGGTAEGVVDGVTGFVVPESDESALAARLVTLLEDEELRRRLAQAAREHVVQNFDLRKQTAKLEEIYDEVRASAARS